MQRLWCHIGSGRRGQFMGLLILMLLGAFLELISIGAVIPFLSALTDPNKIFSHQALRPIFELFEITAPENILLPATILFCLIAILAGSLRIFLLWVNTRFAFLTGADISIDIYRRTLYQNYTVHCMRNSSVVIDAISNKTGTVISVITMLLTLITSLIMLIVILTGLILVNPTITLLTFGSFALIYIFLILFSRSRLAANSSCIAKESTLVIKSLQEGLGGIREVLIDGSQEAYCKIYNLADKALRRAQASSAFIGGSPRYAMESLGIVVIVVVAYTLIQHGDGISEAIPVLGFLALGAQRLLPSLQQAYSAWSGIQSAKNSLEDAIDLLEQPIPSYAYKGPPNRLPFKSEIKLKKICFKYESGAPYVFKNIDLQIIRGDRVGFIGKTGCGKSTLLDIIMGLLEPVNGFLEIDGRQITQSNKRSWQQNIAHVPQTIYLADSSVAENIAFGVQREDIDIDRVKCAAEQAQISSSIETWQDQYQTIIGERGVRLSGGQRQRIGIARALYKEAEIIIFDEATSALDVETENDIIESIDCLDKNITVLIVAHRVSTLKGCNRIFELKDGFIKTLECNEA